MENKQKTFVSFTFCPEPRTLSEHSGTAEHLSNIVTVITVKKKCNGKQDRAENEGTKKSHIALFPSFPIIKANDYLEEIALACKLRK